MEAHAIGKYIPSSPRKMRLVADLIRGLSAERALEILHYQTKDASKDAEKVLRSAVANIMNNEEDVRLEPDEIMIKEVFVNQGPTLKRIQPAPMGRAYRIRKRSCHLTIVVSTEDNLGE